MRRRWVRWAAVCAVAFAFGVALPWLPGVGAPSGKRTIRWLPPGEWGFGRFHKTSQRMWSYGGSGNIVSTDEEVRRYGVVEMATENGHRITGYFDGLPPPQALPAQPVHRP